jgi:hypothetical protein
MVITFGYFSSLLAISRTFCSVVTCEGGNYLLALKPFAFSKPQVTGDVSPGPVDRPFSTGGQLHVP